MRNYVDYYSSPKQSSPFSRALFSWGFQVTVYMFYKNALLVLPQFFFAFLSLSSGQNFYYDILYQSYNVLFTGFPIIALGVLDQAS